MNSDRHATLIDQSPVSRRRGNKQFDPIFAKWSRSGQLIIGLADGNFALWDSATGQVAKSSKGKAHKSAVTCGDWLYHFQGVSPTPTLALVLASDSKMMFTPDLCSPKPQAKELSLAVSSAGAGNELNESMIEIKVKKRSPMSPVRSPKKLLRRRTFKAPVSQEGLQFDKYAAATCCDGHAHSPQAAQSTRAVFFFMSPIAQRATLTAELLLTRLPLLRPGVLAVCFSPPRAHSWQCWPTMSVTRKPSS